MRIYDGRDSFYQWDSNQKVVHNFKVGDEVHFVNLKQPTALTVRAYQLNGDVVADVPNILLQSSYPIYIYWMNLNEDSQFTKEEFTFSVNQRAKPSGYVYTATEVLSYEYLDARIDELEKNGVSSEQIFSVVEDYLEKNPVTGGASQEEVAQIHKNKEDIEKLNTDKLDASELPEAINDALAQAKASGEFNGDPGDNYVLSQADKQEIAEQAAQLVDVPSGGGGGLTEAQISALDGMFKIAAYTADATTAYVSFKTAFGISDSGEEEPDEPVNPDIPEKTLISISAVYSGGDVAEGTSVTDLTCIVVTATYSDGSTATVTDYTLSGTIVEGSNTITVSYGGKTTTFTVTGVAESGGDEARVSNETTWTDGVAYTWESVSDVYVDKKNGNFVNYVSWSRTPYLYCSGASTLRVAILTPSTQVSNGDNGDYNVFYDADKNFISAFSYTAIGNTAGGTKDIEIPANAVYFIASAKKAAIETPYLEFVPYA